MPQLLKMKKSQIWYMDFIIGVTIFMVIMLVAFRFLTSNSFLVGKEQDLTQIEVDKISGSMMRTGIPVNWTVDDVVSIGLLSEDNVLDINKVGMMTNLSQDYDSLKWLMGVSHDFILYFENINGTYINMTNSTAIGKPDVLVDDILLNNPKNIVSAVRYVVYRHDGIAEILTMKIVVWKE